MRVADGMRFGLAAAAAVACDLGLFNPPAVCGRTPVGEFEGVSNKEVVELLLLLLLLLLLMISRDGLNQPVIVLLACCCCCCPRQP
jgi:hypothetical protein